MDSFRQDLRYALRVLVKSPAFTAITVLTMGLGIGANATVFSFVSALLLRPAPGVADPTSLIAVFTSDFSSGPYGDNSYPDYESLRDGVPALSALAAESEDATAVVRVGDTLERVRVSSVTSEYFDVLGLRPATGRLIGPRDTKPDADPVVVIGHSLWRRMFASDPAVLGETLILNARKHTIVGVAQRDFVGLQLGRLIELWTPLVPPPHTPDERGNRGYSVVGRLRPSASLADAQGQVSVIANRLALMYPDTNKGTLGAPNAARPMIILRHTRLDPEFRGMVSSLGAILMAAVGLVLLIACANIASLLLSRATARDREMAVRLALGAGRPRVIGQLMTESLLLGLAGGAFGLLFALWTADLLPSFFGEEQARMLDVSVDGNTVLFVLGLSLVASVLFGLAPALQAANASNSATLRTGAGRVSEGGLRAGMRKVLVAAQVALAIVLLIGAALLTQSVVNGKSADPGFATRDALVCTVELPPTDFSTTQGLQFYAEALEHVRNVRGVLDVAFVRTLPTSRHSRRGMRVDGYVPVPGEDTELSINVVSIDYFKTLQIPLIAGRTFDSRDRDDGAPVAIVNELLAKRFFGGKAVGRKLTDSQGRDMEVIGVVRNTVALTIQSPLVPVVYYPLAQSYESRMVLVARTAGDPLAVAEAIRRELSVVNRNVPVFRTMTLAAHMAEASADSRLTAALVAACGAMALLLATIGVYGVIAHAVARRTREIGVRLALGARPWHIVHLVMSEGVTITMVGILLGLAGAALASRGLESLLYGVTPSDPVTYLVVPAVLALVAAVAACAPARRALSVEPNAVLRQE
jgi:predicted permease